MNGTIFFSFYGVQQYMNIIYSYLYTDERIHLSRVNLNINMTYKYFNNLFEIPNFTSPIDLLNEFNKGIIKTRKVKFSELIETQMNYLDFKSLIPLYHQKYFTIIQNNILYEDNYTIRKYITNINNNFDIYDLNIYMLKEKYNTFFIYYYIKRYIKNTILLENKNNYINFINNGGNILDLEISIPTEYNIERYAYIHKLIKHFNNKQSIKIKKMSKCLDDLKSSYAIGIEVYETK